MKLNSILEAAIEDAFDELKTSDEMHVLRTAIFQKINAIYWTKKNQEDECLLDELIEEPASKKARSKQ